ncbi:hypothetical protein QCE73_37315 [Caballeronia sp. LZ029]|uniref:hypothetical protein n=1 Tax=Caballeronia sp. LZ029 TaxID=3038564 RepID=UPI002856ECC1|nr:hypothetical protein [Caballeronia sp. LZ029]MDR5748842.1 hypothetical protein [Caballeronia sp. LZ029]
MDTASYKVKVNNWEVSSADDPRTELLRLDCRTGFGDPTSCVEILLYLVPAPKPGLLEQAIGAAASALDLSDAVSEPAFSISVRGIEVKHNDTLLIQLANGDRSSTVMTATVDTIQSTLEYTRIVARTALHTLACTRVNHTYQNQSVRQIVNDLAQQASVDVGDVDTGSTYPCLPVHESRTVLGTLTELGKREGFDVYVDVDNKLTMKAYSKSSADHTLYYAIDILSLSMDHRPQQPVRVVVVGESPSSSQGSSAWPWIVRDSSSVKGEVGSGNALLALRDGALRSKDAVDLFAKQKFGAAKDVTSRGRCRLLGNPLIKLGDAIEIKDAPKPELNGLFKVTQVRHVLSKSEGFLTHVEFSDQGGAASADSLLGSLGKLAGAIGI